MKLLIKAYRDITKLVPRVIIDRNGKRQTVYIKVTEKEKFSKPKKKSVFQELQALKNKFHKGVRVSGYYDGVHFTGTIVKETFFNSLINDPEVSIETDDGKYIEEWILVPGENTLKLINE